MNFSPIYTVFLLSLLLFVSCEKDNKKYDARIVNVKGLAESCEWQINVENENTYVPINLPSFHKVHNQEVEVVYELQDQSNCTVGGFIKPYKMKLDEIYLK